MREALKKKKLAGSVITTIKSNVINQSVGGSGCLGYG
jgi:hypothetical protein